MQKVKYGKGGRGIKKERRKESERVIKDVLLENSTGTV